MKFDRMKHVVLVGNTAWSMYNFRAGLVRNLIKVGYNVTVVAPADMDFDRRIEELGAVFVDVKIKAKSTNPVSDLKLIKQFRTIFELLKPDFVFLYTIKPNIYGSFAARLTKTPHIAVTTGLGYTFVENNLVSRIARILYRATLRSCKEVWFLNNDDLECFLQYKLIQPERGHLLKGEGINLDRFMPTSEQTEDVSFLLMARMLWDKGVGEYVEAARILKLKFPDVKFCLLGFLGVGNPSAISERQMEEWQKEGVVEYLGVTNDVVPFVRAASCVVLPSYREGIPITLLEAAATCKPIITTNSVGCRDTVDDHVTGYLCQVKDSISLAEAMEKVIRMSPDERQEMGELGRQKVEAEFDEKLVIDIYIKTLQKFGL